MYYRALSRVTGRVRACVRAGGLGLGGWFRFGRARGFDGHTIWAKYRLVINPLIQFLPRARVYIEFQFFFIVT